jgi:hypothetical protein
VASADATAVACMILITRCKAFRSQTWSGSEALLSTAQRLLKAFLAANLAVELNILLASELHCV